MKRTLLTTVITVAAAAAAVTQMPNAAQAGGRGFNQIGPTVTFGGGDTTFGINSKLGIADNLSLRPYVNFPSGGTNFGSGLTYDWDLGRRSPLTPFVGAGINFSTGGGTTDTTGSFLAGADWNFTREFALNGTVDIPFNGSANNPTTVTVGGAFRF
jgi:hypothetical protein